MEQNFSNIEEVKESRLELDESHRKTATEKSIEGCVLHDDPLIGDAIFEFEIRKVDPTPTLRQDDFVSFGKGSAGGKQTEAPRMVVIDRSRRIVRPSVLSQRQSEPKRRVRLHPPDGDLPSQSPAKLFGEDLVRNRLQHDHGS